MLLSLAMSYSAARRGSYNEDDDFVLMFLDISRAHPHAEITRDVYTQLPEEHPGRAQGLVGKLRVCLYGVRDAGKGFEMKVFEISTKAGAIRGVRNPCLYHHAERRLSYLHHGDDFVVAGPRSQTQWLLAQFREQ